MSAPIDLDGVAYRIAKLQGPWTWISPASRHRRSIVRRASSVPMCWLGRLGATRSCAFGPVPQYIDLRSARPYDRCARHRGRRGRERGQRIALKASVVRDGVRQTIPVSEIVPGDRVAAYLRLLHARRLLIDEALTPANP